MFLNSIETCSHKLILHALLHKLTFVHSQVVYFNQLCMNKYYVYNLKFCLSKTLITSAMDRTFRLAFLLKLGMYTEEMLLIWLTLGLLEMLVMELDIIDW